MRKKEHFDLQESQEKVAILKQQRLPENGISIPLKGLIRANIYAEERLQHQMTGGVEAHNRLEQYKTLLDMSKEVYETYQLLYDNYCEAKGLKKPSVAPYNLNRDYASNNNGNGYDYSKVSNHTTSTPNLSASSCENSSDDFIDNIVNRVLDALGGKLNLSSAGTESKPKAKRGRPPKKKSNNIPQSTKETRDIIDKHDTVIIDGENVQISGKMSSDGERMLEDDIEKLKLVPDPTILGQKYHSTCTNLPHNIIVYPEYYVPKEDRGPKSPVSFSRRAAKCQMGMKLHEYSESLNSDDAGGIKAFADMITSWYDIALNGKYRKGLHYSMEGVIDNLSHICMAFGYASENGHANELLELMWNRLADIRSGSCPNNFFYPFEVKQFDPQYIAKDNAIDRITSSGIGLLYHIKQSGILPDIQVFEHRMQAIIDVYYKLWGNLRGMHLDMDKRCPKAVKEHISKSGRLLTRLLHDANYQRVLNVSEFSTPVTVKGKQCSVVSVAKSLLHLKHSLYYNLNSLMNMTEKYADLKDNSCMNEIDLQQSFA